MRSEDPKRMKFRVSISLSYTSLCHFYLKTHFTIVLIAAGLRDAFIISLNAYESIDATKKGSLARFINHSWLAN
jgi:hypothetical protein